MQLGLLFRWRLRGRVDDGEIVVRVGVIGIGGDRQVHLFLGCFLPAFLARGDTEIIVRDVAFWIDRESASQFCHCVVELALAVVNDAEGAV